MFEDYDDYKEAIKYDDLVVFGSIKHTPLCEILRSDYDIKTCPVINSVFNPTKRVDWNNLKTIIHKLDKKVADYSGADKEKILTDINILKEDHKTLNFYDWANQFGKVFDELCEKLILKKVSRIINHNDVKEEWSYEKNMAFWAGVIEKRRPLVLCSPYHMYHQASNTTIHEMLWLHDNGYTFEPMMTGVASSSEYIDQIKIIAVPLSFQLAKGNEIKIIDYLKKSDQILELYNKNIITPLAEKIYTSNTTLKLSEVNKQYQDMYNEFVNKFNSYFNDIDPIKHQNLDMGTSEVLPLKPTTDETVLPLSCFETQEAAKLFAQSSDTQRSDFSISVPPRASSIQSEALLLEAGKLELSGTEKDPSIESDNKSDTSTKNKRYKSGSQLKSHSRPKL